MKIWILAGLLAAFCTLSPAVKAQTATGLPPDMTQEELSQEVDAMVHDWRNSKRTYLSPPNLSQYRGVMTPDGSKNYWTRFHERAVVLLQSYASDPSPMVRQEISDFVRSDRSRPAINLLTQLLQHDEERSLDPLYHNYSLQELKQWGGPALRDALITDAMQRGTGEQGRPSEREIYLLTVFLPNPHIHQYLQDLAQNGLYRTETYYFQGEMRTRRVLKAAADERGFSAGEDPLQQYVEVALAADQNPAALSRLRETLRQATDALPLYLSLDYETLSPTLLKDRQIRQAAGGNFDEVIFFIHSARFIHDKILLREMVALLHDTRDSGQGVGVMAQNSLVVNGRLAEFDPKNPAYQSLRVCDLALPALVESTGVDVGLPKLTSWLKQNPNRLLYRGFTESELDNASRKLTQSLD